MADYDVIKPSYDALSAVSKTVEALVYVADLIPEEDEHSSLFKLLAYKLDEDLGVLRSQVYMLWPKVESEKNEA